MNEKQLQKNSTVENVGLGMSGILLGFIVVLAMLISLNYFRIISLASLYSGFSILPQKELSQKTETTKDNLEIAEKKAKEAGYEVIWKGPTEDGSGRAILASEQRNINNWVDKFGWQKIDSGNGVMISYRGQGIFEKWEEIPNSEDYYIILINPLSKEKLTARITIDKKTLMEYDFKNGADNRTRLEIENLSYNVNKKTDSIFNRIGYFYNLKKEKIDRIIKKGDVVKIGILYFRENSNNETLLKVPNDLNRIPLAVTIISRRFASDLDLL